MIKVLAGTKGRRGIMKKYLLEFVENFSYEEEDKKAADIKAMTI